MSIDSKVKNKRRKCLTEKNKKASIRNKESTLQKQKRLENVKNSMELMSLMICIMNSITMDLMQMNMKNRFEKL